MQSSVNLQTVGLYTEPNQLSVPEGALTEASNVVIQRDNVIEPRRGFGLFGTLFGTITDRLKELFVYKFRLLRHWGSTLEYDTGTKTNAGDELFLPFDASVEQAQEGLRIKSIESNGNFYFTSSQGIRKLSAATASQFTTDPGFLTLSGGIKAIDFTATPILAQGNITGFLPQDSTVAYRTVWGTIDNNKNLILGVPSTRVEVFNNLTSLTILDFNNLLQQIQNTANEVGGNASIINEPDYVSSLALSESASPQELQANLIALANKLDNNIALANDSGSLPLTISAISITNNLINPNSNIATVTFSSGNPSNYWTSGSKIYLTGFPNGENGPNDTPGAPGATGSVNGPETVTSATSTTITFLTSATGNIQTFNSTAVTTGTPGTITINGHGFKNFDPIRFTNTGGALPAGLVAGTTYYAGNVDANTFQIYSDITLTTPVAITTTGTGTQTVTYFMGVLNTSINSDTFRDLVQPAIPDTPATDDELVALQTYLEAIINALQTEPSTGTPPIISAFSQTQFIAPLAITTGANVKLVIDIPQAVTSAYFLQIYRSPIEQATGTTSLNQLTASDELQQVYEAYPTAAELAAGSMTVIDIVPDAFLGADLYTNESSGVGIVNANETPPFALDINKFKNTVFLANTRTKYRMSLNLLGVAKMIADYLAGNPPTLVISDGITTNTYTFVLGVQPITQVVTVADVAGSLAGKYFLINSGGNTNLYYIWYNVSGTGTDPMVVGRTGVEVFINTGDSAASVASKTTDTINTILGTDFSSSVVTNTITITANAEGFTTAATAGTSGFTITTPTPGQGEDAAALQILLSNKVSPAQAVDETAKSMVHVINKNPLETIYAFYLSQSSTVPGEMTLESRLLTTPQYYLLANNTDAGSSFNPDLSPKIHISSITTGNPNTNIVTTTTPHGLITGDQVMISATDSTPNTNGLFTIIFLSTTTFRINTTVTSPSTTGEMIAAVDAVAGDDEAKPNRIYFSRLQQPEAFPLPNTIDVGDADKPILRIMPLRDSLFVFKEDGTFRISGETAPFSLQLFDTSCVVTAPDSVAVAKNIIYAWTTQGILSITEAGVSNPPISRPIDTLILPLINENYPNFATATWGIGYESDNSYIVYTVKNIEDVESTIAYRYSILTTSWTTWDKTNTCGIVNIADDKLYLGAGNINSIEQERKNFNRFDYADRAFPAQLNNLQYFGNVINLTNITNANIRDFAEGDVITQEQTMTVYEFNALLEKLDLDYGLLSNQISSITTGSSPVVTTIGNHVLSTGDYVNITNTQTTPVIDGLYQVTVLSATTFQITVSSPVLTAGTQGVVKYSYYNTLQIAAGANLENALNTLANRLNIEPNLFYKSDNVAIISNSIANPTIVTTAPNTLGPINTIRKVRITGNIGSTPSINGDWDATIIDSTHLSIPVNVTVGGTGGTLQTLDDYITGISPKSGSITNISVTNPTVITSVNHGFVSNRYISITGTNSSPVIDGNYNILVIDKDRFSIPINVLAAGNTGTYTTLDGTFPDLLVNYNYIISLLNKDNTHFRNYSSITEMTSQETIIANVNYNTKQITIDQAIDFVVGPLVIYKAINSTFTYSPVTFKDTLNFKQVSEATMMFENKAFSTATLSFKSDLIPSFFDTIFSGNGNGSFGLGIGKFGGNFFGGGANAAPFRTYIPRNIQRCRYIVPKFTHSIAFEKYIINGLTLSGTVTQSPRAYR